MHMLKDLLCLAAAAVVNDPTISPPKDAAFISGHREAEYDRAAAARIREERAARKAANFAKRNK